MAIIDRLAIEGGNVKTQLRCWALRGSGLGGDHAIGVALEFIGACCRAGLLPTRQHWQVWVRWGCAGLELQSLLDEPLALSSTECLNLLLHPKYSAAARLNDVDGVGFGDDRLEIHDALSYILLCSHNSNMPNEQ